MEMGGTRDKESKHREAIVPIFERLIPTSQLQHPGIDHESTNIRTHHQSNVAGAACLQIPGRKSPARSLRDDGAALRPGYRLYSFAG